ncbi:hypothetical protein D3Z48_17170, partial [Clostridiaceae bacterium]|nr:hypothetical protein [Clostridiaceae bacterium]
PAAQARGAGAEPRRPPRRRGVQGQALTGFGGFAKSGCSASAFLFTIFSIVHKLFLTFPSKIWYNKALIEISGFHFLTASIIPRFPEKRKPPFEKITTPPSVLNQQRNGVIGTT